MFSDAKIGDRVWDSRHGCGVIVNLDFSVYPIIVDFPDWNNASYTLSGYEYMDDIDPSLFWDEIGIKAPPKPLPKLEVDTKVIVWDEKGREFKQHFSHFDEDGMLWAFGEGKTSFTSNGVTSRWNIWKLAE